MAATATPATPQSGDDLGFVPAQSSDSDSDLGFTPAVPATVNEPQSSSQPYAMPNGRLIDPETHTGGIPNPHAVPSTPPQATVSAAPPQSWFQRARQYVANSTPGENLYSAAPGVSRVLGIEPTESETARLQREKEAGSSLEYHPVAAAKQVGAGVENLGESGLFSGMTPGGGVLPTPAATKTTQPRQVNPDQAALGATQVMSGAMGITKPLLPVAAAMAPLSAAIYYGAGVLAGNGAADIARKMGATPNEEEFYRTAGFFIPSVLTGLAGIRAAEIPEGATIRDPVTGEAVPVRGSAVAGRGFTAGHAVTGAGEHVVQGRVGPFSAQARFGGNTSQSPAAGPGALPQGETLAPRPAPQPDAVALQQQAQQTTIEETAARAASIAQKAAQAAGLAPPPPPPPKPGEPGSKAIPLPAGMENGQLSQETVNSAAKAIQQLPPPLQAKGTLEAVGKLAKWMLDQKTFVGPDGMVVNVDSPKLAQTEAVKLINAEVERQQTAATETAKAQKEASDKQQKDAETAAAEREEARATAEKNQAPAPLPDTPQMQTVRAALAKVPADAPKADVIMAARKAAAAGPNGFLLTYPVANQLADEHIQARAQQETAVSSAQSGQQLNPDQDPIALGKLANDVENGKSAFLQVADGTKFKPAGLTKQNGFVSTNVRKAKDPTFNGTYFHPKEISPKDVRAAASGESPLLALHQLEANWQRGQATPEEQGRSVLSESPEQTQLGNPEPRTLETMRAEQKELRAQRGAALRKNLAETGEQNSPETDAMAEKLDALDKEMWPLEREEMNAKTARQREILRQFPESELTPAELQILRPSSSPFARIENDTPHLDQWERDHAETKPAVAETGPKEPEPMDDVQLYREARQAALARGINPETTEEWGTAIAEEEARILAEQKNGKPEAGQSPAVQNEPDAPQVEQPEEKPAEVVQSSTANAQPQEKLAETPTPVKEGKFSVFENGTSKRLSGESYTTPEEAGRDYFMNAGHSHVGPIEAEKSPVALKPGQKVTVRQQDGTQKPDEIRLVLPNKKVVLKGSRKPVKVEDVSPAETAIAEHRAAHKPGTFAQAVIDHGKLADRLAGLLKDPNADPKELAEVAAKVDELAPEIEKETGNAGGPVYAEDLGYEKPDELAKRTQKRTDRAEQYRKNGQSSVDAKARALSEVPLTPQEQAANAAWDKADRAGAPEFSMVQRSAAEPRAPKPTDTPDEAYSKAIEAYRQRVLVKDQDGYNTVLNGLGALLEQKGLEPPAEYAQRAKETGTTPFVWELSNLFHSPLAGAKGTESPEELGKQMDFQLKPMNTPPHLLSSTYGRDTHWHFDEKYGAEGMRQYYEGEFKDDIAETERTAQVLRRKAEIVKALIGETERTKAAKEEASKIDKAVANEKQYAETRIKEKEAQEAEEKAAEERMPLTRAEHVRTLADVKFKPSEAWKKAGTRFEVKLGGHEFISDSQVAYRPDLANGKAGEKSIPKSNADVAERRMPDDALKEILSKKSQQDPMEFLGVVNDGKTDQAYFTFPNGKVVTFNAHKVKMLQNIYGKDAKWVGKDEKSAALLMKDGQIAGVLMPMRNPEPIDVSVARKTLAAGGYKEIDNPKAGTSLYSNPLADPALYKKYIGEPLMKMAEPLRTELAERSRVADQANNVHDMLQNLDRTNRATTLEAKGLVRSIQDAGFSTEDGKEVFRNLEDPAVKLTPKQEELRDNWIKPMNQETRLQYVVTELIKSGKFDLDDILEGKVPEEKVAGIVPDQENYQHRIPVERDTFVDKLLGDSLKRFRAPGNVLSRIFPSAKRTIFKEIHGPDGQREVVAVKNGRVTQFVSKENEGVLSARIADAQQDLDAAKKSDDVQRQAEAQASLDGLMAKKGEIGSAGHTTLDLGPHLQGYVSTAKLADEAVAPMERKLAGLQKEFHILHGSQGRARASAQRIENLYYQIDGLEKQIAAVRASVGPEQAAEEGLTREQALQDRIKPLQDQIQKLTEKRAELAARETNTRWGERQLKSIPGRIQDLRDRIDAIGEEMAGQGLEGNYWRDKNGDLWKFDRGTTEFISSRTGQKYHADARLAGIVNYMETNKAMNAAIVLERAKGMLESEQMAIKTDNPKDIPDGWKGTSLQQMRGYYFPAHVADAFDQFDYLQQRGAPNVLEMANNFVIQTVLMNPLFHGLNIGSNWFAGKEAEALAGKGLRPSWYADQVKAGIEAANMMKDWGGPEYQRLLRLGLDLRGADTGFDVQTKETLRSFTDQLEQDKESNALLSTLAGVQDVGRFMRRMNHEITFGMGDLALSQAFYAKRAELMREGVPNAEEAARDWAHRMVGEYTTPIRLAGSPGLGRLAENPLFQSFFRYHFGYILRPLASAIRESIGEFKPNEEATEEAGKEVNEFGQSPAGARSLAIARLIALGAMAVYVFPKLLDQAAKKITGDERARAPRGGLFKFASDAYETATDERSLSGGLGLAHSVFTPGLGVEKAFELATNRDDFTGRHIFGSDQDTAGQAKQVGAWLIKGTLPGQQVARADQSGLRQVVESLAGFKFPVEYGIREAVELRRDEGGSNPPDPQKTRVFQSIMAAAEQSHRTMGQDTSLHDALLESGKLTDAEKTTLREAIHEPAIVFAVRGLEHPQDYWRVYEHSTDEEKASLLHDYEIRHKINLYQKSLRAQGKTGDADRILAVIRR